MIQLTREQVRAAISICMYDWMGDGKQFGSRYQDGHLLSIDEMIEHQGEGEVRFELIERDLDPVKMTPYEFAQKLVARCRVGHSRHQTRSYIRNLVVYLKDNDIWLSAQIRDEEAKQRGDQA